MGLQGQPARLVLLFLISLPASAQQPASKPPEPPRPRDLALSPAPAPIPALRYRLLPSSAELTPGDAAPIYLRNHGYEDRGLQPRWQQIRHKAGKWLALPLDQFPIAEAGEFIGPWTGRKFAQLEYGARRRTCDWNYTLPEERSHAVEINLPDAQEMRNWGCLLAIKARIEIASGRYDDAVRTIETGIAFARHVGGGPFLINGLVGASIANQMLDEVVELIGRPGAPNLYWALTALPHPLISLRDQAETDQKMLEYVIPELGEAELARPRNPAEWSVYLARMHGGFARLARSFNYDPQDEPWVKSIPDWTLGRFKAEALPAARGYLKATRGFGDEQLGVMPDDQLVALYLAGRYHELNDEVYKAAYLPAREAIPQIDAAEKRLKPFASGPLALTLANLRLLRNTQTGAVWPDRLVADLRVIEAIRLHAAAHGGQLPDSLEQITVVPVPEDPATGKPFLYRRSGDAAILHGPLAGLNKPLPTYRITIRR